MQSKALKETIANADREILNELVELLVLTTFREYTGHACYIGDVWEKCSDKATNSEASVFEHLDEYKEWVRNS